MQTHAISRQSAGRGNSAMGLAGLHGPTLAYAGLPGLHWATLVYIDPHESALVHTGLRWSTL
eukprot:4491214-Lingulodinium_polyedra.AAC.1